MSEGRNRLRRFHSTPRNDDLPLNDRILSSPPPLSHDRSHFAALRRHKSDNRTQKRAYEMMSSPVGRKPPSKYLNFGDSMVKKNLDEGRMGLFSKSVPLMIAIDEPLNPSEFLGSVTSPRGSGAGDRLMKGPRKNCADEDPEQASEYVHWSGYFPGTASVDEVLIGSIQQLESSRSPIGSLLRHQTTFVSISMML